MKILITGATGLVGRKIVKSLLARGHKVAILTRSEEKARALLGSEVACFKWANQEELPPLNAFDGVDALINLMGENIADGRWTEARKKQIADSRIGATNMIAQALIKLDRSLEVVVSTSAIGFYGEQGSTELNEQGPCADDFLAKVCHEWEQAAQKIPSKRTLIYRLGVVLAADGGALSKMLLPFKLGLGGPVGSGKQYMSWIHIDDLVELYCQGIEKNEMKGVYNATSDNPVTNKEFTIALGKALHRPTLFIVPPMALKLAMGEASSIVLGSIRVKSNRLSSEGFQFKYRDINQALGSLV